MNKKRVRANQSSTRAGLWALCTVVALVVGAGYMSAALPTSSEGQKVRQDVRTPEPPLPTARTAASQVLLAQASLPEAPVEASLATKPDAASKMSTEETPEPESVSVIDVDPHDLPTSKVPDNFLGDERSVAQAPVAEVEPNDTASTATPLGGRNVVGKGNIYKLSNGPSAATGDLDYWSFNGIAGDRVYAATMTSWAPSSSIDTTLELIGTDGTTILETDLDDGSLGSSSSSIAGATLPTNGTFYLRVRHSSNTSRIAPYFIHFRLQNGSPTPEVEPNDGPAAANPLPTNGWVSGARNPAIGTEQDWFSFSANAGDTVYLSLDLDPERDNVQWNGRVGIALFGDAGNQILVVDDASVGSATNPLSEALFMTVKTTGTYYAYVDSATATVGGPTATYNLSVSVHPATPIGANCTVYTSTDVPKTIGPGAVTTDSTITIPGNPRIEDLNVSITLDHTLMADVDAALISPAGNENSLFTDIGATVVAGQTLMDLDLDDEAGMPPLFTVLKGEGFQPETNYRLNWFKGELAGGRWTLRLRDDANVNNGGNLTAWSITVCEPREVACGGTLVTKLATDFEANNGGFTPSAATLAPWQWGTPTAAPINTCNSGVNCWKTNLTGAYNASANQDLVSPTFSLSGLAAPITVSWAQKYQLESASFDTFWLDVREVGPTNATNLFQFLDATMTDSVGSPSTTINETAGWGLATRDISAYANKPAVQLRWGFVSDSSGQYAGVAIDDVTVTGCCTAASCDDGNPCTNDLCDAVAGCVHTNNDGAACSDGNACTGPDVCAGGVCVPGPNPCNDNNACTNDICDGAGGCSYTPVSCDDGNVCTDDVCTAAAGCVHTNNTLPCSDGNACTMGDVCSGGVCVPGGPPAALRFCSTVPITIPSNGAATPYPDSISVAAPPIVCSVTVDLDGITHTFPDDIDVLLSAPAGQNAIIMSDVGGGTDAVGVNLTLDDAAANPLPDGGPLVSGTFKPTNVDSLDTFPAPAPAPLGGSALSVFNGTNPNGTWNLWVVDDASGDSGSMSAWCLNIRALCESNADCNDGNVCTDDACVGGACVHTNNTAACSDGDPCTEPDLCAGGVCVPGINPCDDRDLCTTDVCGAGGSCTYTPVSCDDGNPCTDDSCSPAAGCTHVNNTAACSDGNPCTIGDVCAGGVCVPGAPPTTTVPIEFCALNLISIPSVGTATPYPASIAVVAPPVVCRVTVRLNGITHTFPDDIDVLLSGPAGQNAIVMSDVGGSTAASGVSLLLDDAAANVLPDTGPLVSGTFQPTNVGAGDPFAAPAPVPLGGSALSVFSGTNPNGTWNLWVVDDVSGDSGSMDGWCINLYGLCGADADCNDGNACTDDACVDGSCVHTNNTAPCDDGNACTANDACANGVCVGGSPASCDDGNVCTTESCNPATGQCEYVEVLCNDNNPCTDDVCVGPTTGCVYTPNNNNPCSDNDSCTQTDVCQNGVCVGLDPLVCNDGEFCTTDTCDPTTGACVYTNNTNACDDGNPCTTGDVCGPRLGENFDGVPAPNVPATWTTTLITGIPGDLPWTTVNTSFDTPPNSAFADDPSHVTDKVLDSPPIAIASASAKLTFKNRFSLESGFDGGVLEISIGGGAFDDIVTAGGSFASGGYTGTISTAYGSPIAGRFAWTGTSTGYPAYLTTIVNLPAAAAGQQVVLRWRVASDTSVAFTGQNIDTVVLVDPTNTCGGTAADCNDNNPCTDDSCDPQTGGCVHTNNTSACDDGNACTEGDTCANGSCQPGVPTVCNDGNVCTDDQCDPRTGGCVFTPNSAACDDGNPCTAGDVCGDGVCHPGAPITAPPEVGGLVAAADKVTYGWSAALFATQYDVVRGLTSALPVGPGGGDEFCFNDLGGATLVDATIPAAGDAFWYLVRGENTCGNGTYGTQGVNGVPGLPRVTATCP